MVGLYPPGYSALLVPLLWIFGNGFLALRVLSVACYAALFPLTWHYLGRRRIDEPPPRRRSGPDGAVSLARHLRQHGDGRGTLSGAVPRHAPPARAVGGFRAGRSRRSVVSVILSVAGLVWLKEAALAMVPAWSSGSWWQHKGRQAVAVAGGSLILLLPVAVARLAAGRAAGRCSPTPRSSEPTTPTRCSTASVTSSTACVVLLHCHSRELVPTGSPDLPDPAGSQVFLSVLDWHVAILCVIGFVVWWRHHRDAAVVVVPFYMAETLLWPNVNERRVILVLPVILALYVLGGWARRPASSCALGPHSGAGDRWLAPVGLSILAAVVVVGPAGRPVLTGLPLRRSARRARSRRARGTRPMLSALGRPDDVVETDYRRRSPCSPVIALRTRRLSTP